MTAIFKVYKTKTTEGVIRSHGISPLDIEFTLCGIAFDSIRENEGLEFIEDKTKTFPDHLYHYVTKITCKDCQAVIKYCKELGKIEYRAKEEGK